MRFSEKLQVKGGLESELRKWVIAGIGFRSKLRPVNTRRPTKEKENNGFEGEEDEECTTPTGRGARLVEKMTCPAAPRKRRPAPSATCHLFGGVREFFNPPDLECVFVRHVNPPSRNVCPISFLDTIHR